MGTMGEAGKCLIGVGSVVGSVGGVGGLAGGLHFGQIIFDIDEISLINTL